MKLLSRIITLLVLPSLVADPLMAAGGYACFHPQRLAIFQEPSALFQQEAIVAQITSALHDLLISKPGVGVRRLAWAAEGLWGEGEKKGIWEFVDKDRRPMLAENTGDGGGSSGEAKPGPSGFQPPAGVPAPKILFVIGPSGAGKSTLIRQLINHHPDKFVAFFRTTTRPGRRGEMESLFREHLSAAQFDEDVEKGFILSVQSAYGFQYGVDVGNFIETAGTGRVMVIEASGLAQDIEQLWPGTRAFRLGVVPIAMNYPVPQNVIHDMKIILDERLRSRDSKLTLGELRNRLERAVLTTEDIVRSADYLVINPDTPSGSPRAKTRAQFEAYALEAFSRLQAAQSFLEPPDRSSGSGGKTYTIEVVRPEDYNERIKWVDEFLVSEKKKQTRIREELLRARESDLPHDPGQLVQYENKIAQYEEVLSHLVTMVRNVSRDENHAEFPVLIFALDRQDPSAVRGVRLLIAPNQGIVVLKDHVAGIDAVSVEYQNQGIATDLRLAGFHWMVDHGYYTYQAWVKWGQIATRMALETACTIFGASLRLISDPLEHTHIYAVDLSMAQNGGGDIFLKTPSGSSEMRVTHARRYYLKEQKELTEVDVRVRQFTRELSQMETQAIAKAAWDMAPYVDASDVLIPIPNRHGDTIANRALAQAIALISGSSVQDALTKTHSTESQGGRHDARQPSLSPQEIGIRAREAVNPATAVFIDGNITTGNTLLAAYEAVGGGRGVVYSKSDLPHNMPMSTHERILENLKRSGTTFVVGVAVLSSLLAHLLAGMDPSRISSRYTRIAA